MTDFCVRKSRLFFINAMAVYTEIVLIRWMSAEIRMLAYLKNFTQFACFFRGQASEALPEPATVSQAAE